MRILKGITFCILVAASIVGCKGLDEKERKYSGPRINDENRDTTILEISGVWEFGKRIEGIDGEVIAIDDYVYVISEAGIYTEFDYQGDNRASLNGTYQNCYVKQNVGTLEKLPDGGFSLWSDLGGGLSIGATTNFELTSEGLIVPGSPFITDCKCSSPNEEAVRSTFSQSDLESMLCD